MPDVSFSHKIFIESQSDRHGISTDLSNVDWPHIYRMPDSISALHDSIVNIINRCIPSHNLMLCSKDKASFIDECRKAF